GVRLRRSSGCEGESHERKPAGADREAESSDPERGRGGGGALPLAHALRRRGRALSVEAAGRGGQRLRVHPETLRGESVAAGGRADGEPGPAEDGQRSHAVAQSFAG